MRKVAQWKLVLLATVVIGAIILITGVLNRQRKVELYDNLQEEDTSKYMKDTSERLRLENVTVLKDPYYVMQPNAIDDLIKKNASVEKTCQHKTQGMFDYFICLYTDDLITHIIERKGVFTGEVILAILRLLQRTPGAALIDVGAHSGSISLPLMRYLGNDRRPVISVDANVDAIRALALGIKKNGFSLSEWPIIVRAINDKVDETAIMDTSIFGVDVLVDLWPNLKKQQGFKGINENPKGPKEVKTATLDSHVLPVVRAMHITTAILKMDIEASECLAMLKADQLLSNINIPYIVMEYHPPTQSGQNFNDRTECIERFLVILRKYNYYPFTLSSKGLDEQMDVSNYREWIVQDMIWKKIL